jgi:glycosyltransferase involved in cell wall biosynthesis
MVRVLHVLCDCHGGGAERIVLELAARRSTHVVAPIYAGGELEPEFRTRVHLEPLGAVRRRRVLRPFARLVALAGDADVVHTHLWAGDQWGRPAGRIAGRPVVSTLHNTEGDGPLRDRIARLTAPLATVLVGASEAVADRLRGEGFERVRAIPNGIDLARFSPREDVSALATRIVGVGRLTKQKGFDVLVEAARGTGLEVTLVGEGEDRALLSSATLVGWQSDVPRYLRAADIVAIPSRWEGFGLQAVEAMASGVPIIASDIPPLREVLGPAAVFVAPGDVGAWRNALVDLASDRERRSALRALGLARAPAFGIDEMVERYTALYEELATGARRPARSAP